MTDEVSRERVAAFRLWEKDELAAKIVALEEEIDAMTRLRSPTEARGEPGDWVLVPREPTAEMISAGGSAVANEHGADLDPSIEADTAIAFAAMIESAPRPSRDDDIERVARAICKTTGVDPDAEIYPPGSRNWHLFKTEARAAIGAHVLPTAEARGEPMAWKWRTKVHGEWGLWSAVDVDPNDWTWREYWEDLQIIPLYSHPPAREAVDEEMVERALSASPFEKLTVGECLMFGRGTPNPKAFMRAALVAALQVKP